MSFRSRLSLFFATIVIVPMLAVAAVLFALTADSETGKADARVAEGLETAQVLYGDERRRAQRSLARNGDRVARALRGEGSARGLARVEPAIESAALYDRSGRLVARGGSNQGVAEAVAALRGPGGSTRGTVLLSVTDARAFAREAARLTRQEVRILRRGTVLASTVGERGRARADSGDVELGGEDYRGRFQSLAAGPAPPVQLGVFEDASALDDAIADNRRLIALVLVGFLVLALLSSFLVVRALQGQVGAFLAAARRVAGGDFRATVPSQGSDEFAALGAQFNDMSRQLEAQLEESREQRREFEHAIRRVGDAFAAGLDRRGLTEIAVQTAVAACSADVGRALPVDPRKMSPVVVGDEHGECLAALEAAEREAFEVSKDVGQELIASLELAQDDPPAAAVAGPAAIEVEGVHALAVPLRARVDPGSDVHFVGSISIARRRMPFSQSEADLFSYLAASAAVSIENAALHETVRLQAVTDGLTGLRNVRQFHVALDGEIERSRRFGTNVGLVMFDLDDFKQVNDNHGHQQGDLVLVEIARILRELSRDIDEPARYGGEELAVVLPQTDVQGAELAAQRMRTAIAQLRIPRLDGQGQLEITASFGVAALPETAPDKETLIAAADAALYRAKRAGKNRVERAEPAAAPR